MCDEKRKRSPNWLPSEKVILISYVEKHIGIIENKKTDGISIKRKLAQWQVIADEYNSQTSYGHRTAENLKAQWESMKKAAKKEESLARMHMIKTGGGSPVCKKEDPIHSRIIGLIKTSAVGLHNPFDSDSVVCQQTGQSNLMSHFENYSETSVNDKDLRKNIEDLQPIIELQPMLEENISVESTNEVGVKDWGDYTPQLLQTPVSVPLRHKEKAQKRRPLHTGTTLEHLHKKKIEAIDFQKRLATEERDKANELHDLDVQIKKEILKQEKIKTKILLLELRKKKANV